MFAGVGSFRTVRMRVTHVRQPERMVIEGGTRFLAIHDELTVSPSTGGSLVRYRASVRLVGGLGWASRALDVAARPDGSTSAKGLRAALGGQIVTAGPAV